MLNNSLEKLSAFIPTILNSTANLIINLAIMLFVLYYMLYNGKEMERYQNRMIPLRQENINTLASTKIMVRANALGISLISIIQGIAATVGYLIFGVKDWAFWGFFTGIFAFFPVVGTMIVWVPLGHIYSYTTSTAWQAMSIFYKVILLQATSITFPGLHS